MVALEPDIGRNGRLEGIETRRVVAEGVERGAQPLSQHNARGVLVTQTLDERRAVGPVTQQIGEDIGLFLGMVAGLGIVLDIVDDGVKHVEFGRPTPSLDLTHQMAQAASTL